MPVTNFFHTFVMMLILWTVSSSPLIKLEGCFQHPLFLYYNFIPSIFKMHFTRFLKLFQ